MPFKPGQSGNPNGKPKGIKNKKSDEVRGMFQKLIDTIGFDQLAEDIKELKPKERIDVLLGLSEFVIPKLNRTTLSGDKDNPLTIEDARRALIEKLTPKDELSEN